MISLIKKMKQPRTNDSSMNEKSLNYDSFEDR